MIPTLRNRFDDLDDLRGYFTSLRNRGDMVQLLPNIWLLNDLEQIKRLIPDQERLHVFDFKRRLMDLVQNDPDRRRYAELAESVGWWAVFLNGGEHLNVRKSLFEHLYSQDLEAVIREELDTVLDGLDGRGSFDLIGDFCDPLICRIICRLAGVDPGFFPVMRDIVSRLFVAFEPYYTLNGLSGMSDAVRDFHSIMAGEMTEGRVSPSGMLAQLHRQYGHEGMGKALGILEFFFTAGIETSSLLLCESIFRLMTDLREYLPGLYNREEADGVVDELIRVSSTASAIGRIVALPVTLFGVTLNPGQLLYLNLAGANRDPRYFPHPDTIHPDNRAVAHIAFGKGRRHCVGAVLSRLELKTIIPVFFERFASKLLVPDVGGMAMRVGFLIPGVKRLPVSVQDIAAT
jgi:cytochrome P450